MRRYLPFAATLSGVSGATKPANGEWPDWIALDQARRCAKLAVSNLGFSVYVIVTLHLGSYIEAHKGSKGDKIFSWFKFSMIDIKRVRHRLKGVK